jgi:hypothetical protein
MENLGLTEKEDARRKPLRERASMWEDKVGVKVNLIEDLEDIPTDAAKRAIDEGQRVTGWVVNGEVFLYMPYIANSTEVDKTYLHEVVAHVGMKELLGKDGYKAFCERVFNEVMTDAEREFYRNYPNVENEAQAADEFIAHLAEDVNMDATVWQKIVKIFRDALHNMGIDTRITNADIEAMLRDSYKKLVEENGMAGINEKDETSRFMVTDRNVQNVILKDTEERKLPTTRKEAFEYIPEGGVSFYNKDVNANIKVSRKAVKHTSLHNQQDAYAIFAGMEDIIGNSVKIGNIPVAADEVGHTHSVSVMYVPVNINGTQYSARLIIKELENKGVVLEELSLYNVSIHKEKSSAVQPLNASNEVGGITAKPYSYYKVKDLIHNSQEEDKKILGLNENTRFRVKDDATEAIFATAKDKFGITYDMREAGYILPDGSMLDFSGKHEIRGADTSFLNGQRSVDHRAIQEIAYDFDENKTGVETDLGDFLDRGAIRIDYNTGAINLNVAPTKAQKDRLKRLIERNDGDVYIDFGKGWDTEHYVEYESARASRVLADIDRYFNESIKPSGNIRFRTAESAPVFYSNAEYAVKAVKQDKATPEQWLKMIEKNGGLKAGEDKWLGLSDWLKSSDKKTLTKQEVLDFIKENQIQIEEVVYGSLEETPRFKELRNEYKSLLVENDYNNERTFDAMVDKYGEDFGSAFEGWGNDLHINDYYGTEAADAFLDARDINDTRIQYTTDGLDNKREIALTVPTIESWNESDEIHFGDAGNGRAIAWVRFGETTDSDGKRVLVIDEVQSKRHQEGREKGYRDEQLEKDIVSAKKLVAGTNKALGEYKNWLKDKYDFKNIKGDFFSRHQIFYDSLSNDERTRLDTLGEERNEAERNLDLLQSKVKGIPSAPFEKNWAELAMKRMLRYAAENGFDKVAWTTGEQQAERYDISKSVDNIKSEDNNVEETSDGTLIVKNITIYAGGSVHNLFVDANGVVRGREYDGKKLSDIVGKPLAEKLMEQGDFELEGDGLRIGG